MIKPQFITSCRNVCQISIAAASMTEWQLNLSSCQRLFKLLQFLLQHSLTQTRSWDNSAQHCFLTSGPSPHSPNVVDRSYNTKSYAPTLGGPEDSKVSQQIWLRLQLHWLSGQRRGPLIRLSYYIKKIISFISLSYFNNISIAVRLSFLNGLINAVS